MFGDYVQIIPIPQTKWKFWDDKIHTAYCARIGKIYKISPDQDNLEDRNEDLVFVEVYFTEGFFGTEAGTYYTFFKKRHIIKKTAYDYQLDRIKIDKSSELQDFESSFKKKRDEIFKEIFNGTK